jgi:hypothetical protein
MKQRREAKPGVKRVGEGGGASGSFIDQICVCFLVLTKSA